MHSLLKEFFDLVLPGFCLRAVLGTTFSSGPFEFAQQVLLLVRQFDWCFHHNMAKKVTCESGTHTLHTLATQTECFARLRTFRNRKRRLTRQGGHLDLATQRCLGIRDRHFTVQVVTITLEHTMRLDVYFHIQIAGWPAVHARLAIAARPYAHALVDTSRDLDFKCFIALQAPGPRTVGAWFGNDLACAVTFRAGLLDAEKPLLHAHLAMATASRASRRRRARLGPGAFTHFAAIPRRDPNRGVKTIGRLLQRNLEVVTQIGATIDLRAAGSTTSCLLYTSPSPRDS